MRSLFFPKCKEKWQGFLPYQTNEAHSQKNSLNSPKNHQKEVLRSMFVWSVLTHKSHGFMPPQLKTKPIHSKLLKHVFLFSLNFFVQCNAKIQDKQGLKFIRCNSSIAYWDQNGFNCPVCIFAFFIAETFTEWKSYTLKM